MSEAVLHSLLERIALALEGGALALERIEDGIGRLAPALLVVTEAGGVIALPEHLRETATKLPPSASHLGLAALTAAIGSLTASNATPTQLKAIATELAGLRDILVLGSREESMAASSQQRESNFPETPTDERRAPAVQRMFPREANPNPPAGPGGEAYYEG